ncbi:MAG TPA: C39 family peptidase [Patescibacteria group bacterium]|nr:C39 family peptidase [Patescibacteria group bacterium]
MRKRLPVILILSLSVLIGGAAFAYRVPLRDLLAARTKPTLPPARPYQPSAQPAAEPAAEPVPAPVAETGAAARPTTAPSPKPVAAPLATEANLDVPFTSQAPHANWDMPYQEACEETALIMVHAYLEGAGAFTPDEADRQILAMVDWEMGRFGYYKDTDADEVAVIAKEYYGYAKARVVPIASMEEVKAQVDKGIAVILPAAGRMLHNPYFTDGGPPYHMLVVKGYTRDGKIITNEPGTRRGADYLYDPDVLWDAVHDWNGGKVEEGRKVMVILEK